MSMSESEDLLLGIKDVQVTSPVHFDPLQEQDEEAGDLTDLGQT